jgi:hypothetical protein
MEMGVRADGSDDNSTATNDEHTAPGSTVKYYVIIDNDSPVKVTVTALVDSLRGNISDCKTAGGAASAVGIELDPDDGDGPGDVDPDGADAVSCTFEFTAPSTPNTELKLAVAARVTAGDGQQGADFDDNTKVTTTS